MSEKLLDTLKLFLEKHLVPTVIAVILSFVTYYKTPVDNALLMKFTITGFSVFLFCVWFLAIEFLIWLAKKIQYFRYSRQDGKRYTQRQIEQERETMESIWTEVDGLSSSDYKLLLKFVKNGNKPHFSSGTYFGDCLLNSGWVHTTVSAPEKRVPIKTQRSSSSRAIPIQAYETISGTNQYILKDEIYQLLKYSYEKYGKISHFDK